MARLKGSAQAISISAIVSEVVREFGTTDLDFVNKDLQKINPRSRFLVYLKGHVTDAIKAEANPDTSAIEKRIKAAEFELAEAKRLLKNG